MIGPSLALLRRTLRHDSQLLRAHLVRLAVVGYIFLCLWWAHMTFLMRGAPGRSFFTAMTWLNIFVITVCGVSFFATAISEEKDESTLGILRMAGIGPVALLLGKSTTRLISAALILCAQLPFTLLATTLGGITPDQVLATYIAIIAYTVFLANLGLFCSVVADRSASASGLALVLVLVIYLGVPLVGAATVGFGNTPPLWLQRLNDFSIFLRPSVILASGFQESMWSFQVWSNLIAAVAMFAASWTVFDLFNRDRNFISRIGSRIHVRKTARKSRRAWTRAVIWKDFQLITGGFKGWIVKGALYAILIAAVGLFAFLETPTIHQTFDTTGYAVVIGALVLLAAELSIYASRIFRDEVRGETLTLMLMLPMTPRTVCIAKAVGCMMGAVPAAGALLIGSLMIPEVALRQAVSPLFWAFVLHFFLFLSVTALLSLYVKWGALPLALVITIVGVGTFQYCCMSPLTIMLSLAGNAVGYPELGALPACGVGALLTFGVGAIIVRRVRNLGEKG